MLPITEHARLTAFRWLVVAAQTAMLLVTWPLWQARSVPPLLPVAELPQFDVGWLLLASLAIVLVRPAWGLALHASVLLVGILLDETRLQPEFISSCFLMLATLPSPAGRLIGRLHLVALWFFSGFHKILSPGYYATMAAHLLPASLGDSPRLAIAFSASVAVIEMALGVMATFPRTRKLAALVALPLHLLILAGLVRIGWNQAVWPWNIALAFAGLALIAPWRETLPTDLRAVGPLARVAAVLLLISPLGFYLGIVDAYLAHCLYSANLPMAYWHDHQLVGATVAQLHVPLPPTHRTYVQFFHATAPHGDELEIEDPRWCAKWFGYDHQVIVQP